MLGTRKCLLLSYYGKLVLVTLNAYIFGPIVTGLRQPVQTAMAGGSRFLASHRPGQFSTFNILAMGSFTENGKKQLTALFLVAYQHCTLIKINHLSRINLKCSL